MFPDSWSADRLKVEVDAAYKNRQPVPNKPNMWQGKTPSGVEVTGYLQPKTTVYPKPPMQQKIGAIYEDKVLLVF